MEGNQGTPAIESWYRHLSPEQQRLLSCVQGFSGQFHIKWIASNLPQTADEVRNLIDSDPAFQTYEGRHGVYDLSQSPHYHFYRKRLKADEREAIFRQSSQYLETLILPTLPPHPGSEHELRLALQILGKASLNLGNLLVATNRHPEALKTYRHYSSLLESYAYFPDVAMGYLGLATSGYWLGYRIGQPAGAPDVYQKLKEKAQSIDNLTYELVIDALRFGHLELTSTGASVNASVVHQLIRQFDKLQVRSMERQLVSAFLIPLLARRGDSVAVIDIYEKTLPPTDSIPPSLFPLLYMGMVAASYSLTGNPAIGMGLVKALRQQTERLGYDGVVTHCDANLAYLYYASHKPQQAFQIALTAQVDAERCADASSLALVNAILAIQAIRNSEFEKAKSWIGVLPQMVMQISMLSYPDLFFDLFFEAFRLNLKLHQKWDLKTFCTLLGQHKSDAHDALYTFYEIIQNCQLDAVYFPEQTQMEQLIQRLRHAQLLLPLGNLALGMARRCEKLGREDLQYYGRIAYSVFSSIAPEIIPESWHEWLETKESSTQLVSSILAISRTISSYRSLEDLYSGIVDLFGKITVSERRALFLVDETGVLRLKAARNFSEKLSVRVLKRVKKVALHRHAEMVQGGDQEPVSQLYVPLVLRDRLIGVIYEENQFVANAFTNQDMEILTTFGMQLAITIDNVQAHAKLEEFSKRLRKENRYYHEIQKRETQGHGIIGKSQAIQNVLEQISQVAQLDTTVLITGETGVGKELVAACIHYNSNRRDGAFVIANCAALAGSLIESELFGHEKGAFTGADQRKIGLFELADQGTLFLDEIGELPVELQGKLLRVLQNQEFQRVGGNKIVKSNFRLVAATNRNLRSEVQQKSFRRDLYYRLNVFPIEVPPLRERKEDIPPLVEFFIKEYSQTLGKPIQTLDPATWTILKQYDWPGNVRELRHVIERAVILSREGYLSFDHLSHDLPANPPTTELVNTPLVSLEEATRLHILRALDQAQGQIHGKGGAAEILDLNPNTLRSKMLKLGIKTKKTALVKSEAS